MKKVAIFLAAIALTTGVFAQFNPPTKDINWFGSGDKDYANAGEAEEGTGIRRTKSEPLPIAPATLLLLGLGGAVVGTRVVRNTKK
ncbi:MAG: hypothetical protein U0L65_08055 [Bacteroidales bacterium]|nr:hypothetical protein [Bacteroidales bacterium]